jgi:hypothetical protein
VIGSDYTLKPFFLQLIFLTVDYCVDRGDLDRDGDLDAIFTGSSVGINHRAQLWTNDGNKVYLNIDK